MSTNANRAGVADPTYPGTVLDPNDVHDAADEPGQDVLSQFGEQITPPAKPAAKPNAEQDIDVDEHGVPVDPKLRGRYEYHQSRAGKAEARIKELEEQLSGVKPILPLIEAMRRDESLLRDVQTRLTGTKPLEAPQRPDNYSEAEAYSNPESTSFKYRVEYDKYRDAKIAQVENALAKRAEADRQQYEMARQQQAEQQRLLEFQNEMVKLGLPQEEFNEFFTTIDKASPEEMLEFYNLKKSRASSRSQTPRFNGRPGQGSAPRRPVAYDEDPNVFGDQLVNLAKLL